MRSRICLVAREDIRLTGGLALRQLLRKALPPLDFQAVALVFLKDLESG